MYQKFLVWPSGYQHKYWQQSLPSQTPWFEITKLWIVPHIEWLGGKFLLRVKYQRPVGGQGAKCKSRKKSVQTTKYGLFRCSNVVRNTSDYFCFRFAPCSPQLINGTYIDPKALGNLKLVPKFHRGNSVWYLTRLNMPKVKNLSKEVKK